MSEFTTNEINFLYDLARSLLQERDYGDLLVELLDATIQALGADRGCVVVREGEQFRATISRNIRSDALAEVEQEISNTIANAVVSQGSAILIDDALESQQFRDKKSVRRLSLRSVLCAPLIASNAAFALIYLENRDIGNSFTEKHRALLIEICALSARRLQTAVIIDQARRRARDLESHLGDGDGVITADAKMVALLRTIDSIAPTDLPVLIQGETGTGKELLARAIYRRSKRAKGPFVVVNCAAIPATLIESELFGCVRGAHSEAHQDRVGLIGAAHRGTLFLDEIGDMPLELQSRLLRVLQSGSFNRLGSAQMETVDVRVVAATNRDLEQEVEEGNFRQDLYFRLASVGLNIPPLRERTHDIQLLTDHFLKASSNRIGRRPPHLTGECLAALTSYGFPGNIRELEGEIARLVAISAPGEEVPASALSDRFNRSARNKIKAAGDFPPMSLAEMEKKLIRKVLDHTNGNRTQAAQILGLSREGLRTKIQRLGVVDTTPVSQD
jgi:transcriptional regulator with GAF, ATPase, and Fis domain